VPDGAATSCRATVSVSARESPLLPWRAVVFVSCQDAIRVGHQLMRFLSLGGWLFVSVIGLKGLQGNPKRDGFGLPAGTDAKAYSIRPVTYTSSGPA